MFLYQLHLKFHGLCHGELLKVRQAQTHRLLSEFHWHKLEKLLLSCRHLKVLPASCLWNRNIQS